MPKTALITGASSGLGMALSRLLAKKGYDLILIARREKCIRGLKSELNREYGSTITLLVKDLSQPSASRQIAKEVHQKGLHVNTLINNAGFGTFGAFRDTQFTSIESIIQVNLIAMMELCSVFLPAMIKRKEGQILNVASIAAFIPGPLEAIYFSSKSGIVSFSKSLAYELKDTGVHVSAFCPGRFQSEFQEKMFKGNQNEETYLKIPSASKMANYAFKGLNKKQTMIIPGRTNQWIYYLSSIIPQSWLAHAVHRSILNDINA